MERPIDLLISCFAMPSKILHNFLLALAATEAPSCRRNFDRRRDHHRALPGFGKVGPIVQKRNTISSNLFNRHYKCHPMLSCRLTEQCCNRFVSESSQWRIQLPTISLLKCPSTQVTDPGIAKSNSKHISSESNYRKNTWTRPSSPIPHSPKPKSMAYLSYMPWSGTTFPTSLSKTSSFTTPPIKR